MADQPALPLRERFSEWISDADERKGDDIDAVKKKRLEEADILARRALTMEREKRIARASRGLQKVDIGGRKPLPDMRPNRTKPGPGESVPLPTPPISPVTSIASTGASVDTAPVAEIPDFQEIADIRTSLRNHETKIASLRLQLEDIKVEVQDLHKQCRKASDEVAKAVCQGDEENVKKSAKQEENFLKLLEQKNQTIDELRDEIVERKGREGELREKLAEAEGRYKVREAIPTGKYKPVSDGSNSAENRDTIGKDKPENRRNIGKVSTGWEFRRKKGERETPLTAGYRILRGSQ